MSHAEAEQRVQMVPAAKKQQELVVHAVQRIEAVNHAEEEKWEELVVLEARAKRLIAQVAQVQELEECFELSQVVLEARG